MPAESNVLAVPKALERSFERGFKSWCENISVLTRKRLGLKDSSELNPRDLALNMGVTILELQEVPGLDPDTISYLSSAEGDEWSAVTVTVGNKPVIIVNPRHSEARKTSNLMHELAHIIKGHKPAQMHYGQNDFVLRDFNELQENEANWLAGCLLLPRPALLKVAYDELDVDEILEKFSVSKSLYNYRMNISGVRRQIAYGKQ